MGKCVDITGQRFGKLVVITKTNKRNTSGQVYWECKCDCGNFCEVCGSSLRSGHTKSCGCYSIEVSSQKGKNHLKDRVGQKYGKLLVLDRMPNLSYGNTGQYKTLWKCQCNCGKICNITGDALQSGKTKSCGCLTTSFGEYKIETLLKEMNLPYEKEKIFSTCRFNNGKYARFDFYVNNEYLIEFDGKQHFLPEAGWGEDIKDIQLRDEFKNKWCKKYNIPLIRIDYLNENNITKENLTLATTKFRYI